jgi:hypothetical protein
MRSIAAPQLCLMGDWFSHVPGNPPIGNQWGHLPKATIGQVELARPAAME